MVEIVFVWCVLAWLVALIAARNGRSALGAFALAVVISPLLAGIVYLVAGRTAEERRRAIFAEERIRAEARARYGPGTSG